MGVYQALDGNMQAQVDVLQTKADAWSLKLHSSWHPCHLVHHSLTSTIWASLQYPLLACTITEKQGSLITKKLFTNLLPKVGVNRNFPLAYRHAPMALPGLGLLQIRVEQLIGQICQILIHGAIDSTTGSLLCISFEQAQLEVGISIPFLEASYDCYSFLLMDTWWKSIWHLVWTRHPFNLLQTFHPCTMLHQ